MNKPSDLVLEYKFLNEVTSTNDILRQHIPTADITVRTARHQTHGRGQAGNTWTSEPGKNALFSVLVCPKELCATDAFVLSQAMALSIKEVLEQYVDRVHIKWPNDIYCHGKKICGILIENTLSGKHVGRSVIGCGLNVNQTIFPEGLAAPATSLHLLTGNTTSPAYLIREITDKFLVYYQAIEYGMYAPIRELYNNSLYLREQKCCFQDQNGTFIGRISHAEASGHLVIIDDSGAARRYAFKQVRLARTD